MLRFLLLTGLTIHSAYASQGKPLTTQRIGQLVDQTFGTISQLETDYFSQLKERLIVLTDNSYLQNHLIEVAGHFWWKYGKSKGLPLFDNDTEKKLHDATTLYMRSVLEERLGQNWNYYRCHRFGHFQFQLQHMGYVSLSHGFDSLFEYLLEKKLSANESFRGLVLADRRQYITGGILEALKNWTFEKHEPRYSHKRIHYINAIKLWLKKCESDFKRYTKAPLNLIDSPASRRQRVYIFRSKLEFSESLNNYLDVAATMPAPQICSLFIQYGADPAVIKVPPDYREQIQTNQDPQEQDKMRVWDLRTTVDFFHAFEALKNDPDSFVHRIPTELISEIRKYRWGMSRD